MELLYVGSYTPDVHGEGVGITVWRRDGARLTALGECRTPAPSYLVADRRAGVLFAVNEMADGGVSSYRLGADGVPNLLSSMPTGGAFPCHLALHRGCLISANYGSGHVGVHRVRPDGAIGERTDLVAHEGHGPHARRQEGPHPHQVLAGPGDAVTVVDLGIDRLVHYRLTDGRLSRLATSVAPPGMGPRHAVVHPSGRWYVVAELASDLLTLESAATTGALTCTGNQPTTASGDDNLASAIVLSADGRHLYVANRGANSIATFLIDDSGEPTLVEEVDAGGDWPRDLALAGEFLLVANQRSHTVVAFGRDVETGRLQPTGEVVDVGSPTCLLPW